MASHKRLHAIELMAAFSRDQAKLRVKRHRALEALQKSAVPVRTHPRTTPVDTLTCRCGQRRVLIEDAALHESLLRLAAIHGFDVARDPAFKISIRCAGCLRPAKHRKPPR